ncbi:NAD(+) diphosphatase [Chelatococcus asaccharovorans]|uniref:NAD(+) diphosphatase n=1 Tax=Chelatococcus asaccharovorans TaxID=28210 RepID=A0A2V3UJU6_9HYPH|nr:NAD(+) diphosphatase [Chelatococcus asaccharovorans]MBS7701720.1 NAD(+) diphosphatase [Chelatococcus asaccharovorans]PXW64574.1 NAD+ diphosphatase [Chelatococcus asaccharovorans]
MTHDDSNAVPVVPLAGLRDRSARVGFAINRLERHSEGRENADTVGAFRQRPDAGTFVLAGDVPILKRQPSLDPRFTLAEAAALGADGESIFLGTIDGVPLFTAALATDAASVIADRPHLDAVDLRSLASQGLLDPDVLGPLGEAKAILHWHQRHRFCANCGAATRVEAAGWRRICDACGAQHFPRTDPVVIMLAVREGRCLLGRQPRFADKMYSCLAGFVEPGETIEDAVRRETKEEAGLAVGRVRYLASQPWPFPASLMIGCIAEALHDDITIDRLELEDARWFSRQEAAGLLAGTHPDGLMSPKPFAIAHHLLHAFVHEEEQF